MSWFPYIVAGKHEIPADELPVLETKDEISDFFMNMPKTHPHLVGQHIVFIEESDVSGPSDRRN